MTLKQLKIISDSTCDLSKDLIEKYEIGIVPLFVTIGENTYFDGVDLDTIKMYEEVEKKNILPKTAAASPGSFIEIFQKYLNQGYQILYVGIGSKFSATFQSATLAKQDLDSNDIFLVDSHNLSSGSGLLVLKACSLRDKGMSALKIQQKLIELVPKVRSQFVIDTLEYLYKGGRLNALSNFMGTMLKIKPIIKVVDGAMAVGKKARGHVRHGIDLMVMDLEHLKDQVDSEFCMITHSFADEVVDYTIDKISSVLSFQHLIETHAGCVISSHCGKGTIGILYLER